MALGSLCSWPLFCHPYLYSGVTERSSSGRLKKNGRQELAQLVLKDENGTWKLPAGFGGRNLTSIKGIAIFFDKAGDMVPTVYEEFLRKFEAQPEVQLFLHLKRLPIPHVSEEEKFKITKTSLPSAYRLVVRHGYSDIVVTEDLGEVVYTELRKYIITSDAQHSQNSGKTSGTASVEEPAATETGGISHRPASIADADANTTRRLQVLDEAYGTQVVYIVGKEQLRLGRFNIFKRTVLGVFLWIRDNTRAKVASMRIPIDKLVEVGFVKEL